jgi:hypothetical protein
VAKTTWDALFTVDAGGTTGLAWGVFPRRGSIKSRVSRGKTMGTAAVKLGTPDVAYPLSMMSPETQMGVYIVKQFVRFCEEMVPHKLFPMLVVEDFHLRPGPRGTTKREGIYPVRINAAIETALAAWLSDRHTREWLGGFEWLVQPVYQQAAQAKQFATDARIREWGLWVVGSDHKRDANRHLALRLAKLADVPG